MRDVVSYELLDFGGGRRLERFGSQLLDRPCPTAEALAAADPAAWSRVDARFDRTSVESGAWSGDDKAPARWIVDFAGLRFELKRAPFGHVGLFPEQAENWHWLTAQVAARAAERSVGAPSATAAPAPLRLLNLFAYTGGSTLAAARGGAVVTHVDAARNVVAWARRNAELSGLSAAPIRWIAEDAVKFCKRELRRGARYDAVVLDPPSYGHGPRGEVWRLTKHLPQLLDLCGQLTQRRPQIILLTCHTPDFGPRRLAAMLAAAFDLAADACAAAEMTLQTAAGRALPSGVAVRLAASPAAPAARP